MKIIDEKIRMPYAEPPIIGFSCDAGIPKIDHVASDLWGHNIQI